MTLCGFCFQFQYQWSTLWLLFSMCFQYHWSTFIVFTFNIIGYFGTFWLFWHYLFIMEHLQWFSKERMTGYRVCGYFFKFDYHWSTNLITQNTKDIAGSAMEHLQWFSKERMTGYSEVTKAQSRMA